MRSPRSRLGPWRTHSCVERRDSSRRVFALRRRASEGVPARHRGVRAPHWLILLLAASAAGFAQSGPPADPNSASVEGVVLNAVTGEPVSYTHLDVYKRQIQVLALFQEASHVFFKRSRCEKIERHQSCSRSSRKER